MPWYDLVQLAHESQFYPHPVDSLSQRGGNQICGDAGIPLACPANGRKRGVFLRQNARHHSRKPRRYCRFRQFFQLGNTGVVPCPSRFLPSVRVQSRVIGVSMPRITAVRHYRDLFALIFAQFAPHNPACADRPAIRLCLCDISFFHGRAHHSAYCSGVACGSSAHGMSSQSPISISRSTGRVSTER